MSTQHSLDIARQQALRGVARADLGFKACLGVAALVEAAGLIGVLLLADFSDQTHRLILIQTLLVYGTLALGILAVGILVRQGTLRVLAALEAKGDPD